MPLTLIFNEYDASKQEDVIAGFDIVQDGLRRKFNTEIAANHVELESELDNMFKDWLEELHDEGAVCPYVLDNVIRRDTT